MKERENIPPKYLVTYDGYLFDFSSEYDANLKRAEAESQKIPYKIPYKKETRVYPINENTKLTRAQALIAHATEKNKRITNTAREKAKEAAIQKAVDQEEVKATIKKAKATIKKAKAKIAARSTITQQKAMFNNYKKKAKEAEARDQEKKKAIKRAGEKAKEAAIEKEKAKEKERRSKQKEEHREAVDREDAARQTKVDDTVAAALTELKKRGDIIKRVEEAIKARKAK